MNIKQTLAAVRKVGMCASHRNGEYRISYPRSMIGHDTEASAYYTTDSDDAVYTAALMLTGDSQAAFNLMVNTYAT